MEDRRRRFFKDELIVFILRMEQYLVIKGDTSAIEGRIKDMSTHELINILTTQAMHLKLISSE